MWFPDTVAAGECLNRFVGEEMEGPPADSVLVLLCAFAVQSCVIDVNLCLTMRVQHQSVCMLYLLLLFISQRSS